MSTATECTVYNLFSVLCHEPCHESSQFKFQRLWYPIVSYLTILGSSVPKGRPCKWWTWLKAVVVLAKEPNMSSSHSRITNCVIRHVRETFDSLLFASVKSNSAARSWTMLNSVNVSTQYSSHDQRFHSWDAKGSHIAKNESTLNENFRVSPTCEQ